MREGEYPQPPSRSRRHDGRHLSRARPARSADSSLALARGVLLGGGDLLGTVNQVTEEAMMQLPLVPTASTRAADAPMPQTDSAPIAGSPAAAPAGALPMPPVARTQDTVFLDTPLRDGAPVTRGSADWPIVEVYARWKPPETTPMA